MSTLDIEWAMRLILTNNVSTGNAETAPTMAKLRNHRDSVWEGTAKQRNVKAWKATHFRSETESQQQVDNKNRSRCGHMRTVTGKGPLENPVNGEDSLRVEQLDYLLRASSRELNGYVGRAIRTVEKSRMQSNATNANSNRICSSI